MKWAIASLILAFFCFSPALTSAAELDLDALRSIAKDTERLSADRMAAAAGIAALPLGNVEKERELVSLYSDVGDASDVKKHILFTLVLLVREDGFKSERVVELLPEEEREGAEMVLEELRADSTVASVRLSEVERRILACYDEHYRLLLKAGYFEQARAAAANACRKMPEHSVLLEHAMRGALKSFILGEGDEGGEAVYVKFRLWVEQENPGPHARIAASYAMAREYDAAGSTLKGISELRDTIEGGGPSGAVFHPQLLLGYLLGKTGDEKASDTVFEAALEQASSPESAAEARFTWAVVKRYLGKKQTAMTLLSELVEAYPETEIAQRAGVLREELSAGMIMEGNVQGAAEKAE